MAATSVGLLYLNQADHSVVLPRTVVLPRNCALGKSQKSLIVLCASTASSYYNQRKWVLWGIKRN